MSDYRLSTECPRCGEPLTVRKNRRDGTLFLGCDGYPSCRFTEELVPALEELREQMQVHIQQQMQSRDVATSPTLNEISRRIRKTITAIHPDRWSDHPLAAEVTKELNSLREFVAGEERRGH